jgi:hypothetical protein
MAQNRICERRFCSRKIPEGVRFAAAVWTVSNLRISFSS